MVLKIRLLQIGLVCFAGNAVASTGLPARLSINSQESIVQFLAIGKPSMIKIKGSGAKIDGELEISKDFVAGDLYVDLNQFETGLQLRDRHMKEKYLETTKPDFQKSKLTISKISFPQAQFPSLGDWKDVPFEGKLTLHGVTKDVAGLLSLKFDKSLVEGQTSFKIKLSDYAVAIPSFAGVTVAEDVEIEVKIKGTLAAATQ